MYQLVTSTVYIVDLYYTSMHHDMHQENEDNVQQLQQAHDKFKIIGYCHSICLLMHMYMYFSHKFNGINMSFSDSFESYFSITAMLPVLALPFGYKQDINKICFLASTSMILALC